MLRFLVVFFSLVYPLVGFCANYKKDDACFVVLEKGPKSCLQWALGSQKGFESGLFRGATGLYSKDGRTPPGNLDLVPKYLRDIASKTQAPGSEMFAIYSKKGCAIIDDIEAGDSIVRVNVAKGTKLTPRALTALHEAGHCAEGFLKSRGYIEGSKEDWQRELFADFFAIWVLWSTKGPTEGLSHWTDLARERVLTPDPHGKAGAALSRGLTEKNKPRSGEGFCSFIKRQGWQDGSRSADASCHYDVKK